MSRSCEELGLCQSRAVPCLNCTRPEAPVWQPDEVTCTPVEQIAYWAAITVAACLTGGAVVGVAAYVYGRFF
jgi:hypothetical protein